MLIIAALAVVLFLGCAPSIIDRFPYEQRDFIGACVFIPLLFLLVGAVFLLARL